MSTYFKNPDGWMAGLEITKIPAIDPSAWRTNAISKIRTALLDHWVLSIDELWRWQQATFSLRFRSVPQEQEIKIALLLRLSKVSPESKRLGDKVLASLKRITSELEIEIAPIKERTIYQSYLAPFPKPHLFELRQQEAVVNLKMLGPAYVVELYDKPYRDWSLVFKKMLNRPQPTLISIYLQPTMLTQKERLGFEQAVQIAGRAANFQYRGYGRYHLKDANAREVASLYQLYGRRLVRPYLMTAQIISPDLVTAQDVARAVQYIVFHHNEQYEPASNAFTPRNQQDLTAACSTLAHLNFRDWGEVRATPGKERLRYLVDARGAAALFRFPISIDQRMPGISVQQVGDNAQIIQIIGNGNVIGNDNRVDFQH
jgi:hypothetical protein